jgi:hypothetical protein
MAGNSRLTDRVFGRGVDEAYLDFNMSARQNSPSIGFDSSQKELPVHGDASMGLGTSTFLDGTPASAAAINKSQEEALGASLGRKKSIVQRLRGGSSSGPAPPRPPKAPAVVSPSAIDESTDPLARATSNPVNGSESNGDRKITYDTNTRTTNGGSSSGAGGLLRRVKSLKVSNRRG